MHLTHIGDCPIINPHLLRKYTDLDDVIAKAYTRL